MAQTVIAAGELGGDLLGAAVFPGRVAIGKDVDVHYRALVLSMTCQDHSALR